ncbi:hypothetical protein DB32_000143 [Sandaracinus amylolyticus]|uniref:Uncharacterized protein n=1 Tax=Sandaracinus amylolyticus TaxID=927083 RepID=A0A0F6YFY5_9BACT|nr:hypothetical protein DB32_000143 [Sandaracinus amylolyticus]
MCTPACEPGWASSNGSCIPLCNPGCGPGTHCAEDRVCRPGAALPPRGGEPTQEWWPAPPQHPGSGA